MEGSNGMMRGRALWLPAASLFALMCASACSSPGATAGPYVAADAFTQMCDGACGSPDATAGPDVAVDASGQCACALGRGVKGGATTSLECFFGGPAPTLARFSPCNSDGFYDIQRVRYEYPACNRVVIVFSGYYQFTRYVFDRTTGAMLEARTGTDTLRGCATAPLDASACGEAASCFVCAEDPREVPPPASCVRARPDAGAPDGGPDAG